MSLLKYALGLGSYLAFNYIPERPSDLRIEITNRCNLQCTICDRSAMTKPVEAMDWALFEKICSDAVSLGIPRIGLNRFGEPLLHPKLPEMVAFAKARRAKRVDITTNGLLLTEEKSRVLLEAGLDQIAVSVDGFRKQTYEKIRIGSSYDTVVANIHRFISLRDKINPRTRVRLNFVTTIDTFPEVRDFYKYWIKHVDGIWFIPFMGYGKVRNLSPLKKSKRNAKCSMLWHMLIASTDGNAGVCCHGDPNGILNIGDLHDRSITDVWHGPEVQRIRRIHFEKQWRELPICAQCDLIAPYSTWVRHYYQIYKKIF